MEYLCIYKGHLALEITSIYFYFIAIYHLSYILSNSLVNSSFQPPGLYVALGLSGVIPAVHYVSVNSFLTAIQGGGLGWMILMAVLYISGAVLYAIRIPERFFPGKCDIWVSS